MKAIMASMFRAGIKTIVVSGLAAMVCLAGISRAADAGKPAEPLDLTDKYTAPVSTLTNQPGFPAWQTAAVGRQVFHQVPFQIGGVVYLWGEGRSTNHTSPHPQLVPGIAVNRKFQTLYVCHGSYYKSPEATPVCALVFHFEDSSSVTNTLRYGEDILDWKVSRNEAPLLTPYGTNSMLAWMGGCFSPTEKQPLRYCMTALENPQPDRLVTAIDLYSCKSRTIPFILAMTTGRSGLMK
jgi:hypothetical protein